MLFVGILEKRSHVLMLMLTHIGLRFLVIYSTKVYQRRMMNSNGISNDLISYLIIKITNNVILSCRVIMMWAANIMAISNQY